MPEEFLRIDNVVKTFGSVQVVHGVTLGLERGEFVTLLGPSGCGKTTILRMIAGFERPTSGGIFIEGEDITHLPPNQRRLGMVFQSYALFPNLNVAGNIGFGLRIAGRPKSEIRARVEELLALIGMPGLGRRFPFELSGGQQQRVALARALAPRPRLLLLDEPLSALDAKIRLALREQIRQIQRELGITTLFVTHDQEEALSMSDRIVVMNAGRVEQVGPPAEVYNRPATRFVATFVGTLNTLEARVADPARGLVSIDGQTVSLPRLPAGAAPDTAIALTLRPEAVSIGRTNGQDVVLEGKVTDVSFLGSIIRLKVDLGGNSLNLDTFNDQRTPPPALSQRITVSLSSDDILILED